MNSIAKPAVALIWSGLILLALPLRGAVVSASFSSAATVPVTAASYTATGNTVNFTLNFTPAVGTNLSVVKNTGIAKIQGTFDNLAQGEVVNLTRGGVVYPFVANYFGGTGNDLVLHWGNTRLLTWGSNSYGQLGNGSTRQALVPVPVDTTGVLAGRAIIATATGYMHALALCADGTLAAWGNNAAGQLGNNSTTASSVPVLVDQTGVLADRTIVAISAGYAHNLVLCADGTLVTWGTNSSGLGNSTTTSSKVPILVDQSGVLAGKTIIGICAGSNHNLVAYDGYSHDLVVCSDGSAATWGKNAYGQLGNDSITDSLVPVLVNTADALSGKKIVAGTAATEFSLVQCADGTLASWGTNFFSQLGNPIWDRSRVPVLVDMSSLASGQNLLALSARANHSLVLCADGTLAAWGKNQYGQLGNSHRPYDSNVPVLVDTSGALSGKRVVAISDGGNQALCADGTLVAWGANSAGQLGNNSTSDTSAPVRVDTTALRAGERFVAGSHSNVFSSSLVLVAAPPPATATTLAATAVIDTGATLKGSVRANGSSTAVTFEYGLTIDYGASFAATPASATGTTATACAATLSGLLSGTTYHYRVVAASGGGTVTGADMTFTTSTLACLTSLEVSSGSLNPAFSSITTSYEVIVPSAIASMTLTPVTQSASASVKINGVAVVSGSASAPLSLAFGNNSITLVVTAEGGGNTQTYRVTVTRPPDVFAFNAATDVPVAVSDYVATGNTATFALNFAPLAGTNLTVVRNAGANPIQGTFGSLAQGQRVELIHAGIPYAFVANYFGGTGNDLVLQWANTRVLAWGSNDNGQLGNGGTVASTLPVAVDASGVLAGRVITALVSRSSHTLALCADGTVAAWGSNSSGQLGNDSQVSSAVPVAVNRYGELSGKTVIAIAAGSSHSLVLCKDGSLAAWGSDSGVLGSGYSGNRPYSNLPVLVERTGVLAGKTVTAIAAGGAHNLVLCADGTLAAWGANSYGQLGNAGITLSISNVPVLVDRAGVLAGKTVTAIAAGSSHSLALCSDGTLATWGYNASGQLGDGSAYNSPVPVLVNRTSALSGKTVTAIGGGHLHSLALCADGTLATWGDNQEGQLGNSSAGYYGDSKPALVDRTGALAGKTVTGISVGTYQNLARCEDATLVGWGSLTWAGSSEGPTVINMTALRAGERLVAGVCGSGFNLALVGSPPPPVATTLAATALTDTGVTLNGSVTAYSGSAGVSFEYGLTTNYGATVAASPAAATGISAIAASASLSGLPCGTTYHYRIVAAGAGGTVRGGDLTFTTSTHAALAYLTISDGALAPGFTSAITRYDVIVPYATDHLTVTPIAASATATVTVNGVVVASGTASGLIALATGTTVIEVALSAADGINAQTYTVTVTRRSQVFSFNGATDVPLTVNGFAAAGSTATFALNFAPVTGTNLMVLNNTGREPIEGTFDNLAQGQLVNLGYGGMTYAFVANYFGGSGNDLVLLWANTRLAAWGFNYAGQLGNDSTADSSRPTAVDMSGVLAGKTVIALATGTDSSVSSGHSLAVCADGTLAAWGSNSRGKLGNNSTTNSKVPLLVVSTGVLAGKTVIAVAAGSNHCLALCTDGSLAAWGYNSSGQLGNNSTAQSNVPVLVDRTGVLAGKTVVAISAGSTCSLALCADGTLAAWGSGQLGSASITQSSVPMLVDRSGVLAGKTIVALAAGSSHALALTADGSLAAWGTGTSGQLGNGSSMTSSLPVLVNQAGVLAGKSIAAISAGGAFSLALCADGTLAAWGGGSAGQLGSSSSASSTVPVLVDSTGVLSGKIINTIACGGAHSLVWCDDGAFVAWGDNNSSQLGNGLGYGQYFRPLLVNASTLLEGERFVAGVSGPTSAHNLAVVAMPPRPAAATLAASGIMDTSVTLNGSVNGNGRSAEVSFEYGLTTSYGATFAATPAAVLGTTDTPASATISGLDPGTTYHYRIVATSLYGTGTGEDMTFTSTNFRTLAGMTLSAGTLVPAFSSANFSYHAMVPHAVESLTLTPLAANASSTLEVNGEAVASGSASGPIALAVGANDIRIAVTGADGINPLTYTVTVTRLPDIYTFSSASDVPLTAAGVTVSGGAASLALNYAPAPGTNLTVLRNTGTDHIQGTFDNLTQGQAVELTYNGVAYGFVADYFGGTGNDLVLHWANIRLVSWGLNDGGQLGNNSTSNSSVGVAVDQSGVLAGKTVLTTVSGSNHSLALCSDGTLAAWGSNGSGQLGNNTMTNSKRPVLVDRTGVLQGKNLVAIAAGSSHTLALCSDGTMAAWGSNEYGQLGSNGAAYWGESKPVLVNRTGVLAGRTVMAIGAAGASNVALCTDGTLATWGYNYTGQLGNGSFTDSSTLVLVNRSGVLKGKTVTAVASRVAYHLVICSDGTLAGWGSNGNGQLGNSSTSNSNVPVLVDRNGVLAGKTVIAMAAGGDQSLALCADGTLAAWGYNYFGQLGNNSTTSSSVPLLVERTGVLSGKTVTAITAGFSYGMALCADGTLAAWGQNNYGQLGNNSTTRSLVPVLASATGLVPGERLVAVGLGSSHSLALVAMPPPPVATTLAATGVADTAATLNGSLNAQGSSTAITFEYGLTTSYSASATATPAALTGTTTTAASVTLGGLLSGTEYHYRIVATSAGGTVKGDDMTFTTSTLSTLAGLTLSSGTLLPAFGTNTISYALVVPNATSSITVTPQTAYPTATVKINAAAVASGSASAPIDLATGNNAISIVVSAADGISTKTYTVTVTRLPAVYAFNSAATAPVTTGDFLAGGNSATFALNYAPPTGTDLTVVRNTGMNPIQGAFDNLAQGQVVNLTYGGVTYSFVANYGGGTGNDLVLQWANTRLLAWGGGSTNYGQLGNGGLTNSPVPVPVDMSGALAGKSVLSMIASQGGVHNLALASDGSVAAWGYNNYGQLGNGNNSTAVVPVLVDGTGVLAGKTVIAISAGGGHSLALCADGSLAAWGQNTYGQLGDNSGASSTRPVLVDRSGALSSKTVVAVAAASTHSLALCSDGTVVAWGANSYGELGDYTTTSAAVPVGVSTAGVLSGRTVVAISAMGESSLALCSDGAVVAWGHNNAGQLGNNTTTNSNVPVLVDGSGVLSGKTVMAIAAGGFHNMALCSDGTLAGWGANNYGALGNNSTTDSTVPVLVDRTGALTGKTVAAISAGAHHSLARCADGTLAAWGQNAYGQLGNNSTTNSSVPVLVNTNGLATGERVVAIAGGSAHNLGLVALPPAPTAATLAASGVTDAGATLNASVSANGSATTVVFQYGLTDTYSTSVAATPASISGTTTMAASAVLSGLLPGALYHYRVVVASGGGTVAGADLTFTTSTFATLTNLSLSSGTLYPDFSSTTASYIATVPYATTTFTATPVTAFATATVKINGTAVASDTPSTPFNLTVGDNLVTTVIAAADGINTKTYTVKVTRLPQSLTFNSATSVPVTLGDFVAGGNTANFALNYAPTPGTSLMVVKNTGSRPIQGTFDNLANGQKLGLTYGGITYPFVANYSGGSGNDLVLHWSNARMLAWGGNSNGELGNGTTTKSGVAVPVDMSGVLAGRTVIGVAQGNSHSLALCADGTVAAWGYNYRGLLGNNSMDDSMVPVRVVHSGVLATRTPVAIAAGGSHSLALCADGSLAGWGSNSNGQLGNGGSSYSTAPVMVRQTGVLAGKSIVAMAAGGNHSLALCADGTLAAWGSNSNGQLGNNSTSDSSVPVLVDRSGVLAGKTVTVISAGGSHSVVACADGTVAAWGSNGWGQLGNSGTTTSKVPVLVVRTGVLAGKTVTAIASGSSHSVVLCSDGKLVAWGYNTYGQLGNNSTSYSSVPVAVTQTGILAGKTVQAIATGASHTLARCSDGTVAAWGYNNSGQLGNNSTLNSVVPVWVTTTPLGTGERFVTLAGGSSQSLALTAMPPPPTVTTLAATGIVDTAATLSGSVNAQGSTTAVSIEYGLTASYGNTLAPSPATVSGAATTSASVTLSGLLSGTTYHYRMVATNSGGTVSGEDMTFSTTTFASLTSLALGSGTLTPAFAEVDTSYHATVPYATSSMTVTPVVAYPDSTVKVNGGSVASGAASGSINLAVGNNSISVLVTAAGGASTKTYTVVVTRLPATFTFSAATSVPVTVTDFLAAGDAPALALAYAPTPGTHLTVVKNTGLKPIQGSFDNLAQGQAVNLSYNGIVYPFVVTYSGDTGNDLVLQWASMRLLSWGSGTRGQLGNGGADSSRVPAPVDMSGALAGKVVIAMAVGESHSVAVCADGTLATWGATYNSRMGSYSLLGTVPAAVDRSGVLAGKTVVRVAAGYDHSLVLCADGALVAWGGNWYGQLGNNTTNNSGNSAPVLVDRTGVLAGKVITDIGAGWHSSYALCSDGTLAAWGSGAGAGVPVEVSRLGALAGKTVTRFASGNSHCVALCSDGTLAAWGSNNYGQLGNSSTSSSGVSIPVAVVQSGVLAGKTVTSVSAGDSVTACLCSDGTLAAWGYNNIGQLGNGTTTTNSSVAALVTRSGVLAGKTVTAISPGSSHFFALCADGTVAAWGSNSSGQLGNNSTTDSSVPVLVATNGLAASERVMALDAGGGLSLAMVASPPPAAATTLAASSVLDMSASLHGTVNAYGTATTASFEYGLTTAYGATVGATPAPVTGATATAVSAVTGGLLPGTTYHYRVLASNGSSTVRGEDMTFATSSLATLADLALSAGTLTPAFASARAGYLATVSFATATVAITPTVNVAGAGVSVAGVEVASGATSAPIPLQEGPNRIEVKVASPDRALSMTYTVTLVRLAESFAFAAAADTPLVVDGFAPAGNSVAFDLNFAPLPGTDLTVVKNTGPDAIRGGFANLAQGQTVELDFCGVSYPFVADYAGGTGNDLVLRWANTKLVCWGENSYRQLGNGGAAASSVPVPVVTTGVLAGKVVIGISSSAAADHSFALCMDGTLAAWGNFPGGSNGQPVAVDLGGTFSGKRVAAAAAGKNHSLVLYDDNTLVATGDDRYGQLGRGAAGVSVDRSGVLAGKTITAIAAGYWHNLVLCSDGSLVTWGYNASGQLGNGSSAESSAIPVKVDRSGVLAGRTPVAIACGYSFSLAVCADGSVVTWGGSASVGSGIPVLVNKTGVLAEKGVTAVAAGGYHSLALCSDGTLAAWGTNTSGQLGNGTTSNSAAPVLVSRSGALAGKTVTAISAAGSSSLALCGDGTLFEWGNSSNVPVAVASGGPAAGERFAAVASGTAHRVALLALPPPPSATTLAATTVHDASATLSGNASSNGSATTVAFEYGLSSSYGTSVAAAPASLTDAAATPLSATIGGLLSGTVYHYRVIATSAFGTTLGEDMTFTTTTYGTLTGLLPSRGALDPAFAGYHTSYIASVPYAASSITLTPVAAYSTATVTVNGVGVESGAASDPIPLEPGDENVITTAVTAADGINAQTYAVRVTRLPETFAFDSAAAVPVTVRDFTGAGNMANFALNFEPVPGTNLTVVNNTGVGRIRSPFSNLAPNQIVPLTYGNTTYNFVANYAGGTGNDLVLQWSSTRLLAWGGNAAGQLGNGTATASSVPVAVDASGVLAGKFIVAITTGCDNFVGHGNSLALCSDGSLAAWGSGDRGQAGNNSTSSNLVPVLVDQSGVLAGKTVVAINSGADHLIALCSDGTVATWGYNMWGQLGNNSLANSSVPLEISNSGALAGRNVIAVACGSYHSLALCADGALAAWGYNSSGQLGNNSTKDSLVPALVERSGVLAGKTVVAIAGGGNHTMVLCSDGTLAAWGYNSSGQLGNNSSAASTVPVAVDMSGVLAGKSVVGISAGSMHCLAVCSDGTVAAWGSNGYGQLGNNSATNSSVPVWVDMSGVLAGKAVIRVAGGRRHSLGLCSDGTLTAWGSNDETQLGNASTTNSSAPVAVSKANMIDAERFLMGASGQSANHALALVASPLQSAISQPASAITGLSASLNGTVNANGNASTVAFEYGLTAGYGHISVGAPVDVSGTSDTSVSAAIGGLTPGTTYHYRVVASSNGGVVRSADMTFTTLSDNAKLAALGLDSGGLAPDFEKLTTGYVATVPFAIDGVAVTPVTDHFGAAVQVDGMPVASGEASEVIPLPVGNTTITTAVTAEDGIATKTYTITVTRLPLNFTFGSASDVPVSADGFAAGGIPVAIVLDYAPTPGTILTMVNNRGLGFIYGNFSNLTHGQRLTLAYGGTNYDFVANYYGGSGNDLVLQWADTQVVAWGSNSYGQLGDATSNRRLLPTAIDDTGVLAGKSVIAVAGGYLHSLALCSDGTLASWGYNGHGQLGNGGTAPSAVAVAVDRSGVLAGRTVVAIAAGPFHNLALCADGTVAAWGYNNYGQLGTGTHATSRVPVLVNPAGALLGKQVVAVAAAAYGSFALCADGSLAAWGYNDEGELGDGSIANSPVAVAVDLSGALAGKRIASLSAGQYHTLALCTDGTLLAWGFNNRGQLGNDSTVSSKLPIDIGSFGALAGKTVVATRASGAHSLALCADGTLAAWGWNTHGELGLTGMAQSSVPVAIDLAGVEAGTNLTQIALGASHSLALLADGTLAAWGDNSYGQLGNNSTTPSAAPVLVDLGGLAAGARVMLAGSGSAALHSLAVVGLPSSGAGKREVWLQGTAESDADRDGIPDLIEYAFGLQLDPNAAARMPQAQRVGDNVVMRFSQPAGVTGITYGAEWSATLLPGSWLDVPDTGFANEHIFSVPLGTSPSLFLRLKVTGR